MRRVKALSFNLRRVTSITIVREMRRTRCTRQAKEKEGGARDVRHGKEGKADGKKAGPHTGDHTPHRTPPP